MEKIKKIIIAVLILGLPASLNMGAVVFAQQGILPSGRPPSEDLPTCEELFTKVEGERPIDRLPELKQAFESQDGFNSYIAAASLDDKQGLLRWILGCAIKSGKIRLYMVPFYITFIVQFLLSVAGLIAVLFVVFGGYHYVVGGLTEDKEKGKKTIFNALIGLVVALSAWIIVNFIQVALTS